MIDSYMQAVEEFKRVDHLYYVTLKYTRTVDVIRSTIERLITLFEYGVESLLKVMKEEKKIDEIPSNPVGRATILLEIGDEINKRYIESYLKLRKIIKLDYTKKEEFRRHVTMIVEFEGQTLEFSIDSLMDYYVMAREFLSYLKTRVEKYKDDEDTPHRRK